MIHEVDESLRLLMRREALQGSDVDILFEAPTKEWAGRRNTPTIDVYLYDIREDLGRREEGVIDVRNEQGRVVKREKPPRWFKLSYLVTAWTQRPEDEHRLLSACMSALLKHSTLPADVLVGTLSEIDVPTTVTLAMPPPQDRSISDIWSALGGELKPSLDLVVVAPMNTGFEFHVGPPLTEAPIFGFRPAPREVYDRNRASIPGVPARRRPQPSAEPAATSSAKPRRGKAKESAPPDTMMPEAWDEVEEHTITDPLPEEAVVMSDDGTGRVFRMQGMPRKPR